MWSVLWLLKDGIHKSGPFKSRPKALAAAKAERGTQPWRNECHRVYLIGGAKQEMRLLHDRELSGKESGQ